MECLLHPTRLERLACRTTSPLLLLDGGCDSVSLLPTTVPPFCLELSSRVLILPIPNSALVLTTRAVL